MKAVRLDYPLITYSMLIKANSINLMVTNAQCSDSIRISSVGVPPDYQKSFNMHLMPLKTTSLDNPYDSSSKTTPNFL